jgi:hypothetical protein
MEFLHQSLHCFLRLLANAVPPEPEQQVRSVGANACFLPDLSSKEFSSVNLFVALHGCLCSHAHPVKREEAAHPAKGFVVEFTTHPHTQFS